MIYHRFQIGSVHLPLPFEPAITPLQQLEMAEIRRVELWAVETLGEDNFKVEKIYDAAPHLDRYYLTVYSDTDAVMFKLTWS